MMRCPRKTTLGAFPLRPASKLAALLGLALLLGGCSLAEFIPSSSAPPSSAPASATAFVPLQATPTPAAIRLWIDPALPFDLQAAVAGVETVDGLPVVAAGSAEAADLRAEVGGGVQVSRWVYALVAPFASLQEGMTLAELRARWSGEQTDAGPLFVRTEDLEPLTAILGPPGAAVLAISGEQLVDQVWTARPALALLPFDWLEPRWKVLTVDGMTPLDPDMDPAAYPLALSLGVSGPPEFGRGLGSGVGAQLARQQPRPLAADAPGDDRRHGPDAGHRLAHGGQGDHLPGARHRRLVAHRGYHPHQQRGGLRR